jgi:hypothetical protein
MDVGSLDPKGFEAMDGGIISYLSYILIHLVSQSITDRAWEGGFVFPRAQRCRQDGGSGF